MKIISNGSKWSGEKPDTLARLIEVLAAQTLDPKFEEYGNFVSDEGSGYVYVHGNFLTVSHVFSIRGLRDELGDVIGAIRANQETEAYKAALRELLEPVIAELEVRAQETAEALAAKRARLAEVTEPGRLEVVEAAKRGSAAGSLT